MDYESAPRLRKSFCWERQNVGLARRRGKRGRMSARFRANRHGPAAEMQC